MLRKLFFVLLLILLFASPTYAQKTGITVSPYILKLDLAQDKPEATLNYTNESPVPITLSFNVQDFDLLENGYKVSFLSQTDSKNYSYSLSSWVSFETQSLQLDPGETKSLKIFIDKERITKGSHYATIQAQINQEDVNKEVNVKAVLSSLLFVRSDTGKEIETGNIVTLRALQNLFEFPSQIRVRFQNSGNVDVTPYGLIEIKDPLGKTIAKAVLNSNSDIVLPETIRNFDTDIKSDKPFLLPGFYNVSVNLHFGKYSERLTKEAQFFSQGSVEPWMLALIGILFVALLIGFKKSLKKN